MAKVTMFHPQSGVTQEASEAAFHRQWASEGWVLVDEPKARKPKASKPVDPNQPPDGSIDEVIDWVRGGPDGMEATDGWRDRAQAALAAEHAKGDKARKTLVERLEEAVTKPEE